MKRLIAAFAVAISLLTLTSNAFAYEVKNGDTMSEIAKAHGMELTQLGALNTQVEDLNVINVGETIQTAGEALAIAVGVSDYERDLLARLVHAEAKGEPYEGKVAVAAVVLNRVESDKFPDSIASVVYQKGQFSPVSNGSINAAADEESKRAANEAVASQTTDTLFFYNAETASSRWLDSRPTTQVIGNHTFKK